MHLQRQARTCTAAGSKVPAAHQVPKLTCARTTDQPCAQQRSLVVCRVIERVDSGQDVAQIRLGDASFSSSYSSFEDEYRQMLSSQEVSLQHEAHRLQQLVQQLSKCRNLVDKVTAILQQALLHC